MTGSDYVAEIVDAVAAADDVEPTEVESLHEYVDPEIVARLGELERGMWSFTFQFSDHQVTITSSSRILVDGVPRSTVE